MEIRPNHGEWEVLLRTNDDTDREDARVPPHPLGFYHFPITTSPTEAFKELHSLLITKHEDEIKRLQESLTKLKQLQPPSP